MAEITDPFAPSTPIDTFRFGIDAEKRHEARSWKAECEIAVHGANE